MSEKKPNTKQPHENEKSALDIEAGRVEAMKASSSGEKTSESAKTGKAKPKE